jgi:arylsulfatase
MRASPALGLAVAVLGAALGAPQRARGAEGDPPPPNVLVIFATDVGPWSVGAYHRGLVGGPTPSLDRLAEEGLLFTDAYGHADAVAARAAFLTGQLPVRTGAVRGVPSAAPPALAPEDPTLVELLRGRGYTAGHFGPSLLGDRNDALPTARGFDAFFGPLYPPDAAAAAEDPEYPDDPAFRERFARRGVLRCAAAAEDDAREDPRFGRVGRQRCEDTGPVSRARLEGLEAETLAASLAFHERAAAERKPFFVWHNTTRMHAGGRLAPEWRGRSGFGAFADGMLELDHVVGQLLAKLEAIGVADSTIVVFTSDRGPSADDWPDAGATPFRGAGGTSWEGAVRVPLLVRWPGRVQAGTVSNELFAHEDWLPTLLAAAGAPGIGARLREGLAAGERTWRVHLDGYEQLGLLLGMGAGARREFFYFDEDGVLRAVRVGDWKLHLVEPGGEPLPRPPPLLVQLRLDPFEHSPASSRFGAWHEEKKWVLEPLAAFTSGFLDSFEAFPPRRALPGFDPRALRERMQALAARAAAQ